MVRLMKPITAPVLICLMLALSMVLGGITTGRAAGMAVLEASMTRMVICADGEGPQTVLIARDGTPIDLPHCTEMLCEDCLQAGSVALLHTPFAHAAPSQAATAAALSGSTLHHPEAVLRARSRAPPVVAALE